MCAQTIPSTVMLLITQLMPLLMLSNLLIYQVQISVKFRTRTTTTTTTHLNPFLWIIGTVESVESDFPDDWTPVFTKLSAAQIKPCYYLACDACYSWGLQNADPSVCHNRSVPLLSNGQCRIWPQSDLSAFSDEAGFAEGDREIHQRYDAIQVDCEPVVGSGRQ